uniref:TATA element modulatory factor 1 TATA binding domain-containing protein n=1 Tax=Amorphochlora amoebiformis TaxID=1561963 RepID=A0A7S0DAA0_9EUKA
MSKKQHGKDVLIRNLRKETEDKNLEIQKLKRELESKANDMRSANTKAAAANNEAEETTSKLKFLAKKNSALSERLLEAEGEARKFQQIATKQQEALKSTAQKIRVRDSKIEKAIASLRERKKEKEELQKEVTELQDAHEKLTSLYETARVSLKQVEKKLRDQEEASAEHERTLQKQMQDLRRKMHERELLWQEASEAIPQATRPLLERIAVLSQTLEYNKETQVEVERNHAKEVSRISHTLKEVNRELNQKIDQIAESKEIFDRRGEMVEKLHTKYTELTKQYDASQAKVKKVEEDIMRITQQANDLKSNRQELINARENAEEKLQQLLVTTRLEHNKLRQALASERSRRKDLAYRIKALQQTVNQGNPKTKTPGTPIMFSKQQTEEEVMRSSLTGKEIKSTNEFIGSPNKQAEGLDQVTWQMIDKMRSEVRQKEGSIFSLRQKIKILEDHRKTLSEKMVELTRANAENETRLQNADKLEAAHREVSSRYEIAMDVIGEKEEELVHLRGDMEHIKEKFREQIELLIDRIETLEGKSKKPAGLGSPDTGKTSEKSAASRSEKKD